MRKNAVALIYSRWWTSKNEYIIEKILEISKSF
jgi:hypothetical protein